MKAFPKIPGKEPNRSDLSVFQFKKYQTRFRANEGNFFARVCVDNSSDLRCMVEVKLPRETGQNKLKQQKEKWYQCDWKKKPCWKMIELWLKLMKRQVSFGRKSHCIVVVNLQKESSLSDACSHTRVIPIFEFPNQHNLNQAKKNVFCLQCNPQS